MRLRRPSGWCRRTTGPGRCASISRVRRSASPATRVAGHPDRRAARTDLEKQRSTEPGGRSGRSSTSRSAASRSDWLVTRRRSVPFMATVRPCRPVGTRSWDLAPSPAALGPAPDRKRPGCPTPPPALERQHGSRLTALPRGGHPGHFLVIPSHRAPAGATTDLRPVGPGPCRPATRHPAWAQGPGPVPPPQAYRCGVRQYAHHDVRRCARPAPSVLSALTAGARGPAS